MNNDEIKNRYSNGVIYAIRSFLTNKYYIGSTCMPLYKRFYGHKQAAKSHNRNGKNYISSCKIINYGDAYIELLENYPCNSKNELNKREGELIRQHKDVVVNVIKGQGTTKEEQEETYKERFECECGWHYTRAGKAAHLKTLIHIYELKKDKNDLNN